MKKLMVGALCATALLGNAFAEGLPGDPCGPGVGECIDELRCIDGFCSFGIGYAQPCPPGSTDQCAVGFICYTDEYGQSLCLDDCAYDHGYSNWQSYPPGIDTPYQYRYCTPCSQYGECEWGVHYRCAPNYYGKTTDGESGCSPCPSSGTVSGRSDGGAESITECYIPSGSTGTDSSGSFTYTSKCYYSN